MRIVSLIASATEIVCALGFEKALVGRSHECDFPESVNRLPVLTEPKFLSEGSSREIDRRVKSVLQEALSVYRVDAEALRALRPDVVITQAHCEVCAVSVRDVEQAVCEWLGTTPKVVVLQPNSLSEVWAGMRRVAAALGAQEKGEELVRRLQGRMEEIRRRAQTATDRPHTAFLEWIDPVMAGGNWMPELVEMAGGEDLFGLQGRHSPQMPWEELTRHDPDVIIIAPCGFGLDRTRAEARSLPLRPGWPAVKAVQTGRIYAADGNQYFNRPGPRLVESLEILAEVLHPELFQFGHEGKDWENLSRLQA
ncbi:MAG: cobalamin-binding protein [Deltaproteobacteria bacterium]|nr:cobalamin-binding protein [Deltaproteobacteria bacterium]